MNKSLVNTFLFYTDIETLQEINYESTTYSPSSDYLNSSPSTSHILTDYSPSSFDSSPSSLQSLPPAPRQSTRPKRKHAWLNDYACNLYVQEPYLSNFTESYVSYMVNAFKLQKPHSYKQEAREREWVEAMQK